MWERQPCLTPFLLELDLPSGLCGPPPRCLGGCLSSCSCSCSLFFFRIAAGGVEHDGSRSKLSHWGARRVGCGGCKAWKLREMIYFWELNCCWFGGRPAGHMPARREITERTRLGSFFQIGSWEGEYGRARSEGFVVPGSECERGAAWNFTEMGHPVGGRGRDSTDGR